MNGGSCSDDHCICQKGYIGTHCGQRKWTWLPLNVTLCVRHYETGAHGFFLYDIGHGIFTCSVTLTDEQIIFQHSWDQNFSFFLMNELLDQVCFHFPFLLCLLPADFSHYPSEPSSIHLLTSPPEFSTYISKCFSIRLFLPRPTLVVHCRNCFSLISQASFYCCNVYHMVFSLLFLHEHYLLHSFSSNPHPVEKMKIPSRRFFD